LKKQWRASYERSIHLNPRHAEYRNNRSLLLLLLGSFDDGWREYEWRRERTNWVKRQLNAPEWGENRYRASAEALVYFFKELGFPVNRIGFEAGPLSQWLHAGLTQAGFETVLLETRHVKAALSAMTVKTDRKDACGLAQLLRMGWFQQVHAKSIGSQEIRALLVARKQLLGRLLDVELSIRGESCAASA